MSLSELMDKLSCYRSKGEQDYAVGELADKLWDPSLMIMPRTPDHWHNAARVLRIMGRPRIDTVLPLLLCWLENPEHPGYDIIASLLQQQLSPGSLAELTEAFVRSRVRASGGRGSAPDPAGGCSPPDPSAGEPPRA